MPIQYHKNPVTLQEKVDAVIRISYSLHNAPDGEFLRKFLVELMEKGYTKVLGEPVPEIQDLKKTMQ